MRFIHVFHSLAGKLKKEKSDSMKYGIEPDEKQPSIGWWLSWRRKKIISQFTAVQNMNVLTSGPVQCTSRTSSTWRPKRRTAHPLAPRPPSAPKLPPPLRAHRCRLRLRLMPIRWHQSTLRRISTFATLATLI